MFFNLQEDLKKVYLFLLEQQVTFHSGHQHSVNEVVEWFDRNTLKINTSEAEEILFASPSECHYVPIVLHNEGLKQAAPFKYLARPS